MPILTVQTHIFSLLDNLQLPGTGGSSLVAVVKPPDPETEQLDPHAYIVVSRGPERRESVPRPRTGTPGTGSTQAGWKQMAHTVDIFLIWFQDAGDPAPDQSFPVIVDAVMDALRCSEDPVLVQDPVTFRYSQVFAVGEDMSYDIMPPRAVRDQRLLRYDGQVTAVCKEEFQA